VRAERARDDGVELVIAKLLDLRAPRLHHAVEAEVEVGLVEEKELVDERAELVECCGSLEPREGSADARTRGAEKMAPATLRRTMGALATYPPRCRWELSRTYRAMLAPYELATSPVYIR
jgi:hypothetical protein